MIHGSIIIKKMTQNKKTASNFDALGITPKLLQVVKNNFTNPTPIQHQVIPSAIDGKDIVGIAQTGTGKTMAFAIPIIQRLAQNKGQALIILPTRELAQQVDEAIMKIGRSFGLKTAILIGGASIGPQIRKLRTNPHIIISTPGRLADHLKRNNWSLKNVKIIVLDEADRMLDIGFAPEITKILNMAPKQRQTLLFSATMPAKIATMAATYMKTPLRVEVAPAGTAADHVEQEVIITDTFTKMKLLGKVLSDNQGTVLIFTRTKRGADKVAFNVSNMGHKTVAIHSNKSQSQRQQALRGFKTDKYRIMVATDIASRGIDVKDISLVVNYDLPDNNEDYVHRIGRTGRAGKAGKAITFATMADKRNIKIIERLIKKSLPIINSPFFTPPDLSHRPARHVRNMSKQKKRYSRMYRGRR